MKKHISGFTLIEMLISTVILLVIFSVIGAMMQSTRKTYQATAEIAEEVEITDAAARLIRYDISMAGYIGLDGVDRNLEGNPISTFDNELNAEFGEVIEVRYFEDRFTVGNEAELRFISYYVGQNQEGFGLLRDDNTNPPQLLMSGVDKLLTDMTEGNRGINLSLLSGLKEQLVRISFNIPSVIAGQ